MNYMEELDQIRDDINTDFMFDENVSVAIDRFIDEILENEKIKQALEKQIPKKPFPDKYDIKRICPSCGTTIQTQRIYTDTWGGKVYKTISPKHCDNCGQKLDWSEEE